MKEYKVIITETLTREVNLFANSIDEAEFKARRAYANCKIVLDEADFESVNFTIEEAEQ